MQLLNTILSIATFVTLVSSEACVAGGPSEQVTFAKNCCFKNSGTWYQFYDVQAICVFPDSKTSTYKHCLTYIPFSQLDTTCIPGDGGIGLMSATLTTSDTARITFTPDPTVSLTAAAGTTTGTASASTFTS